MDEIDDIEPKQYTNLTKGQKKYVRQRALDEAEWAIAKGPLGFVILNQRNRGRRADTFANWIMGALIMTVLVGLGYYVGVPLWQQVQDGERRAHLAQADIHNAQLLEMDQTRDEIWSSLKSQLRWRGTQRETNLQGRINAIRASTDGQTIVGVGVSGTIARSTDNGDTWEAVNGETRADLHDLLTLSYGQFWYAIGEGGVILRSLDDGRSWDFKESGVDTNLNQIRQIRNGKTLIAIGDAGAIVRSTDGGESWDVLDSGLINPLSELLVLPDESTLVAFGSNGTITQSRDGGATWEPRNSQVGRDFSRTSLLGDETIIAAGKLGAVTKSVDGGGTWQRRQTATTNSFYDLHVLPGGQSVIAVGSLGTIARSTDGGDQWTIIDSGTTQDLTHVEASPDGQILVAFGESGILTRSTDGGATWRPGETRLQDLITGVAFLSDGKTLVAVDAYGSATRSFDGGDTWHQIDDLKGSQVPRFLVSGDERRLIGHERGGAIITIDSTYSELFDEIGALEAGYGGDERMRETLTELPGYLLGDLEIQLAVNRFETLVSVGERQSLETRLARSQAAAAEIASGGFSLEQRREDFARFMQDCRSSPANVTDLERSNPSNAVGGAIGASSQGDVTQACADAYVNLRQSETPDVWQILSERAPQAVLLLFLLATLGGLFRYNTRLAGFYYARADALELIQHKPDWTPEELSSLGETLAADKVEFGKSNSPSDQAVEMAKAILARK